MTVLRYFYSLKTYKMLFELARFKYSAIDVLTDKYRPGKCHKTQRLSTHEYLRREGFSDAFRDQYLIPLISMLWGMNATRVLSQFPIEDLCKLLFYHRLLYLPQHGPKWQRIKADTSILVQRMANNFPAAKIHLETKVSEVRHPGKDQFKLITSDGRKWCFDHIVFAVDAQECLRILNSTILPEEQEILKEMRVSEKIAVLHSDPTVGTSFVIYSQHITDVAWSSSLLGNTYHHATTYYPQTATAKYLNRASHTRNPRPMIESQSP